MSSYPLIPTALFLSVLWHKTNVKPPVGDKEDSSEESENGENKENIQQSGSLELLVHYARLAPAIEGGIEAPLQFLLQVSVVFPLAINNSGFVHQTCFRTASAPLSLQLRTAFLIYFLYHSHAHKSRT